MKEFIRVKGAKEHNLKNIDVTIPRDKLVVFTGLSGSGKSSLAFDTIFAEGQRRYVESLSSYARMFLGQMDKPNVEFIEGLSPAIAIDQKTTSQNPRSTVGTVTEIYDYLRLLYANIGVPHCPKCGRAIQSISIDQITDMVSEHPEGTKILVMAPIARGRKGEYVKQLEDLKKEGYARFKIDGQIYNAEDEVTLDKNQKHSISVVVDRLIIKPEMRRRLTDSLEIALKLAKGLVTIDYNGEEVLYSTLYSCPDCDFSMPELTPRMFSFNSPFGACPDCTGLGFKNVIDPNKVVPDDRVSLQDGAIHASGWFLDMGNKIATMQIKELAKHYGFSMKTPFRDLPEEIKNLILYGNNGEIVEVKPKMFGRSFKMKFEGVITNLLRRYHETSSEGVRAEIERLMSEKECETCHGRRLKPEILAVTVGDKNIFEVTSMPIRQSKVFFETVRLSERDKLISAAILKEINERLKFLLDVGLGYLTLARASSTLSGGESQRIRLATQIGSGLQGVMYVLDEPSIGLHQRDNGKLLMTLKRLRDLGNTLIVVEHDEETMREADHIVDIGPGAGVEGGYLVAEGTVEDIMANPKSVTGDYLSGRRVIALPEQRRPKTDRVLRVVGAKQNNLRGINVEIPAGVLTCVTGVSGSGKSSLVNGILYPYLSNRLNGARLKEGKCERIEGLEYFDKIIAIDQSPIGRTPRSNPATYTGVFTNIRELFAKTNDAKARGYGAGRFSFNIKGGRCENCSGDGIIKIEMHFLPDVYVPCEVCGGKRYNRETLEVKYKGKSIFDVLDMTVDEACEFFENHRQIYNKIVTLQQVGLGYIKLGQPSTTLSGGEAQRVKLATELSRRSTGKTVYILDEPTTGLHMADVDKLVKILQKLVEGGNTVIVIEHNLDVIKVADYVVDLGPEGGDGGGTVVAEGTPEEVAEVSESFTGQYLKKVLPQTK